MPAHEGPACITEVGENLRFSPSPFGLWKEMKPCKSVSSQLVLVMDQQVRLEDRQTHHQHHHYR